MEASAEPPPQPASARSNSPACADGGQQPSTSEAASYPAWEAEAPEVDVIDKECFLIRNALTLGQQVELFEYILHKDRTPADNKPRAMVPAPKTLLLGENEPSLRYARGDESVVNSMVANASEILRERNLHVVDSRDVFDHKALSMATIRYEAPDGHFPPHVDHCDDSLVYLASLGCTANFMVKGPTMEAKKHFKFCSGDLLVFNASSKAAVLHSVVSIDEGGSRAGALMGEKFPVLQKHRYGVQCRMSF
jgi:hypothetical protein